MTVTAQPILSYAPHQSRQYWQAEASCQTENPELFYPGPGEFWIEIEAKRVCATCPVIDQCRDYADEFEGDRHAVFGIFAGETATERRDRRKGRACCISCGIRCVSQTTFYQLPVEQREGKRPWKSAKQGLCVPCWKDRRAGA